MPEEIIDEDTQYTLVLWPDSQYYMEEDWFDSEAFLSEESSYFIPTKYIV